MYTCASSRACGHGKAQFQEPVALLEQDRSSVSLLCTSVGSRHCVCSVTVESTASGMLKHLLVESFRVHAQQTSPNANGQN